MKSRRFIGSPEPAPDLADYTEEMRVAGMGVKASLRSNNPKPRAKSPCFARLLDRTCGQPRFFARNQGLEARIAVQRHQIGVLLHEGEMFGRRFANGRLQ